MVPGGREERERIVLLLKVPTSSRGTTTFEGSIVEDTMEMLRDMDPGEETILDTRRFLREMDLKGGEESVSHAEGEEVGDQSDEMQDTSQEEWAPIRINSKYGVTDDVITLQGKEYCFYKIPHKVSFKMEGR